MLSAGCLSLEIFLAPVALLLLEVVLGSESSWKAVGVVRDGAAAEVAGNLLGGELTLSGLG